MKSENSNNTTTISRDFLKRCLISMKMAVDFGNTGRGRPPAQTCMFEIEELENILSSASDQVAIAEGSLTEKQKKELEELGRAWMSESGRDALDHWLEAQPNSAAIIPAKESSFAPTEQQFEEWCERHDLPPHHSRDAFNDAASLYLCAAPVTHTVGSPSGRSIDHHDFWLLVNAWRIARPGKDCGDAAKRLVEYVNQWAGAVRAGQVVEANNSSDMPIEIGYIEKSMAIAADFCPIDVRVIWTMPVPEKKKIPQGARVFAVRSTAAAVEKFVNMQNAQPKPIGWIVRDKNTLVIHGISANPPTDAYRDAAASMGSEYVPVFDQSPTIIPADEWLLRSSVPFVTMAMRARF